MLLVYTPSTQKNHLNDGFDVMPTDYSALFGLFPALVAVCAVFCCASIGTFYSMATLAL